MGTNDNSFWKAEIKIMSLTLSAIDLLPFAILALHFVDKYFLSTGRLWPVYVLTILGSLCTAVYNYMLWIEMGQVHGSIMVFTVNSAWTVTMAVKGIIRLVKEEHHKRLPAIRMEPQTAPAKFKE
jgi:hypothetical protein